MAACESGQLTREQMLLAARRLGQIDRELSGTDT